VPGYPIKPIMYLMSCSDESTGATVEIGPPPPDVCPVIGSTLETEGLQEKEGVIHWGTLHRGGLEDEYRGHHRFWTRGF
jgi:hypothetical protein